MSVRIETMAIKQNVSKNQNLVAIKQNVKIETMAVKQNVSKHWNYGNKIECQKKWNYGK